MNNNCKVLFLIPSVGSGGIETYLLRFLKSKKSEMDFTVLVRGSKSGDLSKEYEALSVPMVFMPLGYFNPLKWWHYFRYFKHNKFEVICDFNANFAGIPLFLSKLAGIKNRIVFYRQGRNHFKPSIIRRLYNSLMNQLVYRNATSILSNSQSAIDFFFPYRLHDDVRFKVINNGIDAKDFKIDVNKDEIRESLGIPSDAFIIGHIGRLDRAKNHHTILKVAKELIATNRSIYLVLCGNGTEKLKEEIQRLDIQYNVRLLGYREDINKILKLVDVFFFPSITEGQPNALIEAMLSGVPFISSNIPSIKETVPVRFHNWLTDPFDSEEMILILKEFILTIEEKRTSMMSSKSELMEKFSAEKRYEEFFKILTAI